MRFVVVIWANQFQGKHTIIRSFTCFTFAYWWSKYIFFHINGSERNIFILAVYDWYGIILQTCCPFIVNLHLFTSESPVHGSTSLVPLAFEEALHLSGEASRERTRERRGGEKGVLTLLSFSTPHTRVSFSVRLSHDFSRLPQKESLLAGYRTACKVIRLNGH